MSHLNEHCPPYCGLDSSHPNDRKLGCGNCFRNPNTDTRMDFGKDIWGNVYTGTINPDATMNTYVNGELLVRGVHPKNVNPPQWGENRPKANVRPKTR